MANPLINEDELYAQIASEHIQVPLAIWDFIYQHIGDDDTIIGLIAEYYLDLGEPMTEASAKEILKYTENTRHTLEQARDPNSSIRKGNNLHKIVIELLNHHVANDTNTINMILGYHIITNFEESISQEELKEILTRVRSIRTVLDKLRAATSKEGGF